MHTKSAKKINSIGIFTLRLAPKNAVPLNLS